jgi:hypothetical protein
VYFTARAQQPSHASKGALAHEEPPPLPRAAICARSEASTVTRLGPGRPHDLQAKKTRSRGAATRERQDDDAAERRQGSKLAKKQSGPA